MDAMLHQEGYQSPAGSEFIDRAITPDTTHAVKLILYFLVVSRSCCRTDNFIAVVVGGIALDIVVITTATSHTIYNCTIICKFN